MATSKNSYATIVFYENKRRQILSVQFHAGLTFLAVQLFAENWFVFICTFLMTKKLTHTSPWQTVLVFYCSLIFLNNRYPPRLININVVGSTLYGPFT